MTPKEKANQLFDKYMEYSCCYDEHEYAKQCTFIVVDEILKIFWDSEDKENEFWNEVKVEINKL